MALVLLIEDEPKIREKVTSGLQKDGHWVEVIPDESSFSLDDIIRRRPSVIILDRLLGRIDTLGDIPELKRRHPTGGLLVISAIDSPLEKAKTLEAGADDYLSKPFSITELLARVKALQRRTALPARPAFLEFSRAVLDLDGRVLIVAGKRHQIPNKEFGILRMLSITPGRVFSKDQILDQVWESAYDVESNAVETAITSLRRRLEGLDTGMVIKNMRHSGYWLETENL